MPIVEPVYQPLGFVRVACGIGGRILVTRSERMNVALRAVYEALDVCGDASSRWRQFMAALRDEVGDRSIEARHVQRTLRALHMGGTVGEWMANLRLLGVANQVECLDGIRADVVGSALELVGDSFGNPPPHASWAPVATLPVELRARLQPPALRQTAGVLLELLDSARHEVWLAAPFVDLRAVGFLMCSMIDAGERGVDMHVITSVGQGNQFDEVRARWRFGSVGRLHLTEVETSLSALGSHAKVLVIDGERGYVGSANLTAAGLGRHIELGVEVAGGQVAELTRVLAALERLGTVVFNLS